MKVRANARRHAARAKANRVEWAIARHVRNHPGALSEQKLLTAVRELRAAGFFVSMALKVNGRTVA